MEYAPAVGAVLAFVLFIALYVGLARLGADRARQSGRSFATWYVLGLLFPVLSLLITATFADPASSAFAAPAAEGPCPVCAQLIMRAASQCRFCGYQLRRDALPA